VVKFFKPTSAGKKCEIKIKSSVTGIPLVKVVFLQGGEIQTARLPL